MPGYKVRTEVQVVVTTWVGDKQFSSSRYFMIPSNLDEVQEQSAPITVDLVDGFRNAFSLVHRAAQDHWQKLSGSRTAKLPRSGRSPRRA